MTEKTTWSENIKECLAVHEMFRKMGYDPDDLFVYLSGEGMVQFALHYPMVNDDKFVIDIGKVPDTSAFANEWRKAVAWWNGTSDHEAMTGIYENSKMYARRVELIMAMAKKGLPTAAAEKVQAKA